MKKIALVFAFAVMSFAAVAQDTVKYGDTCYSFNPVYGQMCTQITDSNNDLLRRAGIPYYQQYKASRGAVVYGIAATYDPHPDMPDTVIGVGLWIKEGDSLICIRHSNHITDRREFAYDVHLWDNGQVSDEYNRVVVPDFEYYFDEPYIVEDTFYLKYNYDADVLRQYITGHNAFCGVNVSEMVENFWYKPDLTNVPGLWHLWGFIFPILRPYCPKPEAPVVTVEGGKALFGWSEGNPRYELSVARRGTDPDSGSIFATTDTAYSLAGLDSGVWYTARVRAACDRYDSLWWSAWSLPAHFYLGSTNPDSLGIATAAGAQFALSPNPAAGQVTVTAEEGLRHIEVYDARGALVYSAAADGTTAVVETKAWPAGQYVVAVETRAGKGSRVLTVTR